MIVVAHQAIRGQFPIELPARLLQGFHERFLRPFGFEYIRAIVASTEQRSCDMTTRAHLSHDRDRRSIQDAAFSPWPILPSATRRRQVDN